MRKKGKKNYRLGLFSLATPICWGSISTATAREYYADFRDRFLSMLGAGQVGWCSVSGGWKFVVSVPVETDGKVTDSGIDREFPSERRK